MNIRRIDTIIVLALAALSGAAEWDASLSTNVHEISGHTIIIGHTKLTVVSPTGSRKDVSL